MKLAEAERELLEVRARVSVQRKVVESVLMTEPSLQAVHSAPSSPLDRYGFSFYLVALSSLLILLGPFFGLSTSEIFYHSPMRIC